MDQINSGWDEGETRLDRVLEAVVERARTLVSARTVMVLLEDRGLLVVAATTGEFQVERRGVRLQADGSAWRHVMAEGEAERVSPISGRLGVSLDELGVVQGGAAGPALLPRPCDRRARGLRPHGRAAGVQRRGRIAPDGLCRELRHGARGRSIHDRSAPPRVDRRRRARTGPLGARAPRRDPSGTGCSARAPIRLAAARPRRDGPGGRDRRLADRGRDREPPLAHHRTSPGGARRAGPGSRDRRARRQSRGGDRDGHPGQPGPRARGGIVAQRLDRELESSVYRLVQEALTNVAKHADAETVWIEVTQDETSVSIVVRDDGEGFDMDSRPTGFGLVGMRERVALAGGSLTIVSTPGVGTVLRGRIPLERAARGLRSEDVAQT